MHTCSACGQELKDRFHECGKPEIKREYQVISGTLSQARISTNYNE